MFCLFNELGAAFVAWRAVGLPVHKAYPAEFVLALPASHVVTAFVLFDVNFASGALLGVAVDVLHAQPFGDYLGCPLDHLLAGQRPVAKCVALQAYLAAAALLARHIALFLEGNPDVVGTIQATLERCLHAPGVGHSQLLLVTLNDELR